MNIYIAGALVTFGGAMMFLVILNLAYKGPRPPTRAAWSACFVVALVVGLSWFVWVIAAAIVAIGLAMDNTSRRQ